MKRNNWLIVVAAAIAVAVALPLWRALDPPEKSEKHSNARYIEHIPAVQDAARAPQMPAQPRAPVERVQVPAGRAIVVQLTDPPAESIGGAEPSETDDFYRAAVREIAGPDAIYDRNLGVAAREFVVQYTELGQEPPTEIREFLITASGALANDTLFQHARTSSEDKSALNKAIAAVSAQGPSGAGALHIGVGELFEPGRALSRHIGVVATHLAMEIQPLPRRLAKGATLHVRGRIVGSWRDVHALLAGPGREIVSVDPQIQQDRIALDAPVGELAGTLEVQFVGDGPLGPGKLLQFQVQIDQPLPQVLRTHLPADESRIQTADAAQDLAFLLLNADRSQHNLEPLQRDARLDAIAREHSADMRDNHFFSHRSPTTGMHDDRLRAAGYKAVASAENLAHNASMFEAEQGLMHSLGHRRNILDSRVTRVGMGVAGEDGEDGHRRWWLTQLFAKPVQIIDISNEKQVLVRAIAERRAQAGLGPLRSDPDLDEVAQRVATQALGADVQAASSQALALCRSRDLLRGKLRSWAAQLPDLGQVPWPDSVDAAAGQRLGLGLAQDPQSEDGHLALVLLVAD